MNLENLLHEKLISKNKEVFFDYDMYWKAITAICENIKKNYDLTKENIGIVGMARGALPMLVSVSHELGIRTVSTIQLKMSNSDNCHDYGKVKVLNECISDEFDKFILLEDIIYKGQTTNAAINVLKQKGKDVLAVYSLVVDEGAKKIQIENEDVKIKYAYEITADDWVYFLWEQNIKKEKSNE